MILKHKTQDLFLLLGLTIVFAISFVTYEQNSKILFANIEQKTQSLDLGFSSPQKPLHILSKLPEILHGKLFGFKNRPQLERLDVNIKVTDFNKLLKDRSLAIESNGLSNPTVVKAKIAYKGKLIKAKLRLKGSLRDHWLSRYRMSFRIALKGDNYILGFKKFSLHKPESRQHPYDQVFSSLLQYSGNIATVHKYIHVYVNGSDWGVMNIEEHVSKEFLEKQKRKESLIVRFGNSERDILFYNQLQYKNNYKMYRLSDPRLYSKLYSEKKHLNNELSRQKYSYIIREKLQGTQLYDVNNYSKALILASIWNDGHPLHFANSRHYFNPYSLRLEPIVSDAWIAFPIRNTGFFPRRKFDPFLNRFIYKDISLTKEFGQKFEHNLGFVKKSILQGKNILTHFHDFFPLDPSVSILPILNDNLLFIKNNQRLWSEENNTLSIQTQEDLLMVVLFKNGGVTIYNRSPNDIKLVGMIIDGKRYSTSPLNIPGYDIKDYQPFILNTKLIGQKIQVIAVHQNKEFIQPISASISLQEYKIPFKQHSQIKPEKPTRQEAQTFPEHLLIKHYKDGHLEVFNLLPDAVLLQSILLDEKAIVFDPVLIQGYKVDDYTPYTIKTKLKGILDGKLSIKSQYQGKINITEIGATLVNENLHNPLLDKTPLNHVFLTKLNDSWKIQKGNWLINKPLIVNGDLMIEAGSNLSFSENAYLLVKGAINAVGNLDNPIKFGAIQGTWKGIYIFQASKRSKLEHVEINNALALIDGLLSLSGGTTFYQSDVDMKNVRFDNSESEDALNIVHSDFQLVNVAVFNSISDGIDFDFSTGIILNSQFNNIGGDALDFSGSQVSIKNIKVTNIKDKAISAGEESTIDIESSSFDAVGIALASKDGSQLTGKQLKIGSYQLHAAMTYVKKGFYSKQPSLNLKNCQINDLHNAFLRQKGTTLRIDGTDVIAQKFNVKKLYKSEIMKK